MRIISLVPSATEMLFALGLGSDVVGVTHECDYPMEAHDLPKVTRDLLPSGLSAAEIDAAVKQRTLAGESIYQLDAEALHDLAPDLIVTQALCSVCAVSYDDVRAIAEEIDTQPIVISLDPHTVGEVLGDARTLAQATDTKDAAVDLVQEASARIDRIRLTDPRRTAPPGRRTGMAGSAVRGRPLDPAAHRLRGRRRHPGIRRGELSGAQLGGGGRIRARRRDRHAVRLRRGDRSPRGRDAP